MHVITQPVHIFPCSNSAMKGNNGTNRMLYHDIATQTIIEPAPCFTVGSRLSGLHTTSRKVTGSIPDEAIGFYNLPHPSSRTMALGVDSAYNRNEYQESSWR
jgi:hypothetical protein